MTMNLDGTSMTANMENDNDDKKSIRTFMTVRLENDDDDNNES